MRKVSNNNYQCSNVPTETYTKKEKSPKGLGLSAVGYDINYELKGVDDEIWIVQYKNGKKVWFRKSGMPKITHEETLIDENSQIKESSQSQSREDGSDGSLNQPQVQPKTQPEKKMTDYNYFYHYYNNKLKSENEKRDKASKKKPKEIQSEIFEEWNRLKSNKSELEELLKAIKNK
jgi:hypothetical protein